eukprot:1157180-Pelagomonas_calceolata.AAC.9
MQGKLLCLESENVKTSLRRETNCQGPQQAGPCTLSVQAKPPAQSCRLKILGLHRWQLPGPEWQDSNGTGVYHPMSDSKNLVEPNGAGITNTTGRAGLAAIAAALTHEHTHIATDSLPQLTSPTQKANPISREAQASCTRRWFKDNFGSCPHLEVTSESSQGHIFFSKVKSRARLAGNECADKIAKHQASLKDNYTTDTGTLYNQKHAVRFKRSTSLVCPLPDCHHMPVDNALHILLGCQCPVIRNMVTERHNNASRMIMKVVSKGSYGSNLRHMYDVGSADRLAQHDLHITEQ